MGSSWLALEALPASLLPRSLFLLRCSLVAPLLRHAWTSPLFRAAPLGLTSLHEDARPAHYLGLRFAGDVPGGLLQQLADANVYASVRGQTLRITPHVYNSRADIDRLLAALDAVVS